MTENHGRWRGTIPNGTKDGECGRTIEMLEDILGLSHDRKKIMRALWLLHDCQYSYTDLRRMAVLLQESIRLRGK